MENVLNIIFENQTDAYSAINKLKELNASQDISLAEMYVVKKDNSGKVTLKTSSGNNFRYTSGFGLIGSLAGILAGPNGILLGAGYGMLLGMFGDMLDKDDTEEYLKLLSYKLPNNKIMLVAHVWEDWATPLNIALEPLNCSIERISVEEQVAQELQEIDNEFTMQFEAVNQELKSAIGNEKTKLQTKIADIKNNRNLKIAEFKSNAKQQSEELKELLIIDKSEKKSFEKSIKETFNSLIPSKKSSKEQKVYHLPNNNAYQTIYS